MLPLRSRGGGFQFLDVACDDPAFVRLVSETDAVLRLAMIGRQQPDDPAESVAIGRAKQADLKGHRIANRIMVSAHERFPSATV